MSPLLLLSLMLSVVGMVMTMPNPSPTSNNIPNLIQEACKTSKDKKFCINMLLSDQNGPKADMKGLAFIALYNVEKTAAATSLSIKTTLDNPEMDTEPEAEDAINDCNEHYLTLIELVGDSVNSLVSNAPNDVSKFMKAAVADLDSCDAGVKGKISTETQVLAARNQNLRMFIDNALSVFQVFQSTT